MTGDIWEEKPEPVWVPRGYYSESKIKEDDVQMLLLEDVDAWLDKVKAHIDWLTSYIDANQLIVNQFTFHDDKYWWKGEDLNEMQEKAEKYDKIKDCVPFVQHLAFEQVVKEYKTMQDKLEAIKTYSEREFKAGYLIKPIDILKILEGEAG